MAALAEATDGIITSFDNAFDTKHNCETTAQFLSWWGNDRMERYGYERFQSVRI